MSGYAMDAATDLFKARFQARQGRASAKDQEGISLHLRLSSFLETIGHG
jgi:hypothetical protein